MNINANKSDKRIEWIDIVKCFGIFAIYLGHFGQGAGFAYRFVFKYHVALFFFVSGCMSNFDNENNVVSYIKKKFKNILIPFWGFALLSVVLAAIINNSSIGNIRNDFTCIIRGCIRNTFLAGSLWFLTCLFVMEIVFKIFKYLQKRYLLIFVSIICYLIANIVITPSPIVEPHMIYNIDSMLYYIIFFCLGYVFFPYIRNLLYFDSPKKKIIFLIFFLLTFVYSFFSFETYFSLLDINGGAIGQMFFPIVHALIIILFNILLARLLCGIELFSLIGKETLFLCGNEYVIKTIVPLIISMLGLDLCISNPLDAYLYCIFLLVVCVKILIPFEKKIVNSIKKNLRSKC